MAVNFGSVVRPLQESFIESLPAREKARRAPFLLMTRDHSWEWDSIAQLYLPKLTRFIRDPGVNGVGIDRAGRTDDRMGRANLMSLNWRIIENGDARFSNVVPNGQYIVRWPAGNGYAYGVVWTGWEKLGGYIAWSVDHDTRIAFAKQVINSNIIAPMHFRLKEDYLKKAKIDLKKLENSFIMRSNDKNLEFKIGEAQKHVLLLENDMNKASKSAEK